MKTLTKRQDEIFQFILETIDDRGRPPTIREIGTQFHISSTNGVRDHLLALKRKGYIIDTPKGQGIEVAPEFRQITHDIPIVGRVPAGPQKMAIEDHQGTLLDELVGGHPEATFALRVQGESMIEAGIFDGDFVLIRKTPQVEQGEIGLAYVDGEATIKRIYREKDHYRLQPENPGINPILVYPGENFQIAGRVVGVVRKF